jgi:hypothetical protein
MSDEVTSAITAALAGAGDAGGGIGESTDTSGSDATADAGTTGDEGTESADAVETAIADGDPAVVDEGTGETATAEGSDDGAGGETTTPPEEVAAKPEGKEKRRIIPFADHERALGNVRKEADAVKQRYEAVRWAEAPEAQAIVKAFALAESDPERFVDILLSNDTYREVMGRKLGAGGGGQAKGVEGPVDAAAPGDMPGPNARTKTADGELEYYDNAGIRDLMSWAAKRAAADALKAVEAKYESRLSPIEKAQKERAQREQVEVARNTALSTAKRTLENARAEWEGFKEHEADIKAMFSADNPARGGTGKLTLDACYRKVVFGKLSERASAARKAAIADTAKKPAAVVTGGTAKPVVREEGDPASADPVTSAINRAVHKAQAARR